MRAGAGPGPETCGPQWAGSPLTSCLLCAGVAWGLQGPSRELPLPRLGVASGVEPSLRTAQPPGALWAGGAEPPRGRAQEGPRRPLG